MKNTVTILGILTILLISSIFLVNACQPTTSTQDEEQEDSQHDQVSIDDATNVSDERFSSYELTSFSTIMIDASGNEIEWKPDFSFARVYYTPKNDIDRVEIEATRTDDGSMVRVGLYIFKGTGVYELKNDEKTGKGIGMAEFHITENGKKKEFFSTEGSQVTITSFDETKGIIAGTIDLLSFFYKGEGMMPDARDMKGTFSGKRMEQ